jgi:hypothetical protein
VISNVGFEKWSSRSSSRRSACAFTSGAISAYAVVKGTVEPAATGA